MSYTIDQALEILYQQYFELNYVQDNIKGIKEPVFRMPIPILPHKVGDIVISVRKKIENTEIYHRHDYFLINYAYRGSYYEQIGDQAVLLHEGQTYISQPYVSHALQQHENEEDALITIRIKKDLIFRSLLPIMPRQGDFLEFFMAPFNKKPTDSHQFMILNGDSVLDKSIRSTIEILILEYTNMDLGYQTVMDCDLAMLFSLLSRGQISGNYKYANKASDLLIKNIMNYLSRNYISATLTSTSEEFSYHPNYISTLIQKETGKTFSELVRGFRLQRACVLLNSSTLPIEEIGVAVGYPHSSNFYKTFKKEYGVSPHQYRLEAKEQKEAIV